MEAFLRYLLFRYGEEALGWTVRQLIERFTQEQGLPPGCGEDVCARVAREQKLGYNLDPDCGAFFWELPTKEQ